MVERFLTAGLAALMLGACQHHASVTPAVLADNTPETLQALKDGLASAMGRAQIVLGAGDPTTSSRITVLPRPLTDLETNSPATPILFQLFKKGDGCFAVREGTEDLITLDGVTCIPENQNGEEG